MKNIVFTLCLVLCCGMSYSQIKVVTDGSVKIGETQNAPLGDLHIEDVGNVAQIIIERSDFSNFLNLQAGTTGNAFYYKNNKRFAVVPSNAIGNTNPDIPNSMFFYGPAWSTPAQAGNGGFGLDNPNEKFHVDGNVKGDAFITNSDLRLKNNVKSFSGGLKEVMKLNPITFNYNGKQNGDVTTTHIGIAAQELQEVLPMLVEEYTAVKYEYDEEGTQYYVGEENFLQVRDSEIKWLLFNAIKDQQLLIEEKNDRIADLESKFEALEAKLNTLATNSGIISSEVTLTYHDLASLEQNSPNPFNGQTRVNYVIPNNAKSAQIDIYDIRGKLMKTINLDHTGEGQLTINADDLPSGIYTYQLSVDSKMVDTKKMSMQK